MSRSGYADDDGDYDHWAEPSAMLELVTTQHKMIMSLLDKNEALLAIAKRWRALDGGAWHVSRHAADKAELLKDTETAIAKATGVAP